MTWAILGIGNEAVSQTTGNSNSKASIGQVQDSTKSQIADIDSLDHEKIIHIDVNILIDFYWEKKWLEIIREHMLIEVNELRKKYGAEPLILNESLNNACQWHAEHMNTNMITSHRGENYSTQTIRAKENNYEGYLVYENVWFLWFSEPCTIKNILQQQIDSQTHFKILISSRMKDLWFWRKWLYFTTNLWK